MAALPGKMQELNPQRANRVEEDSKAETHEAKTHGQPVSNFKANPTASPAATKSRPKPRPDFDWLVLHCLGFGACWGWVHIAFFSPVLWGQSNGTLSLTAWLVNVFVNGCTMVALGFLSLRLAPLTSRHELAVALVLLTAGGTVGLFLGQTAGEGLVFAGSITSGIGTAGILLLWAEAYRSISPVVAKKYTIPWSMALGVLYYLVIGVLPTPFAVLVTTALPIASITLLYQSNHLRSLSGEEDDNSEDNQAEALTPQETPCAETGHRPSWHKALPLRFAAYAAVYCIPAGFIRGYPAALPFATASDIGTAVFAGVAVVMIIVAVASILLVEKKKIDLAYKLVVPLMAGGLLLLPFLATGQEAAVGICIMSGYILFEAYVWASLSDIAANLPAPSALVFGIGKSGMNLGLLAGTLIGIWLGGASGMLVVAISLLIVYMFIVVENVVGPKGGVALPLHVPAPPNAADSPTTQPQKVTITEAAQLDLAEIFSAMLAQRCRILSQRCSLSAREAEVLEFLAKGRSLQSIADTLGVAYSTVKTHTDRIYAKTNVHSRQELIELLERTDEG